MRHVANLKDLTREEILQILDKAAEIKADPARFEHALHRQTLAMIFQKTSTRTRVSFEVGMTDLGGHAIYIDWDTSNFVLSGIQYETEYLSRNVNCIMARLLHYGDLQKIIEVSKVPVINGCCEKFHPCQALTDLFTVREYCSRDLRDIRLTFVGVQNNVANSLAIICDKLGVNLTLATPQRDGSTDNGECRDAEVEDLLENSPVIQQTPDALEAVQTADFVYTDTWIDMQYFNDPSLVTENNTKLDQLMPYQINADLLKGVDCRIMHDMPIHEGYEISAEMVRDPRAIIFEQAENRLHAQKGLLWWIDHQTNSTSG
jgi:ornithine carbamoyltransferase|tara:strand:+ start:588 stop:1538 length:951 start_codon:yes stop_codon:yes gene_type:complete